jgi:hypothetical protein
MSHTYSLHTYVLLSHQKRNGQNVAVLNVQLYVRISDIINTQYFILIHYSYLIRFCLEMIIFSSDRYHMFNELYKALFDEVHGSNF